MAEAFLFEIAGKIISKLADLSFREIASIWGVRSELNRIEVTLSAIKAVLLDAAVRQVSSNQVRDWLEKLQDVLYDMDDLLDDFMTEDLRRQIEVGDSKRKKVSDFFSPSNQLVFLAKTSGRLKELREKFDDIAVDRRNYPFLEQLISSQHKPREESHSFVHASDVFGRDGDKENVLKLLSSSNDDNKLSVLPIVGLGGLGKTTLAKLVFNDRRIGFQSRIWVCASESFDLAKIVEKIIAAMGVGPAGIGNFDLDQMQNWLQSHLESKKFLLVLDDVWNEDSKKWMELRDLLTCGAEGSTVIVTTRSKRTAEIMGTFPLYDLKGLPNDECLSLFLKCAFKDGQGKEHPNLVEIGKAIVNKCGGVPLAVRTLASSLYSMVDESEWNYIKNNEIWEIAQKENDILPILRLSYDQMPIHLRRCFAYCSLYPKDIPIIRDDLISRWISQDYIQSDGRRELEEVGRQYINDLISWSFFHDVEEGFEGEVLRFKMHDLVHDLALSVAGKENFRTKKFNDDKVRHILFCEEILCGEELPRSLLKMKKVRSFALAFRIADMRITFLEGLTMFKCLRLMDLGGADFEELPDSIGRLKHLRYLRLEGNCSIRELPESICDLFNLQTLNLYGCVDLEQLPRNLHKLQSLRNLFLTSGYITCLPEKGLEGLRSLRYLSIWECSSLESLSNGMQHLNALRELAIINCPNLTSFLGNLRYLNSLEELRIGDCGNLNLMEEDMEGLTRLKTLVIVGLPMLTELPRGLQSAVATLKYLYIRNCGSLGTLPQWLKDCTCLSKIAVINCGLSVSLPAGLHKLTSLRNLRLHGNPQGSRGDTPKGLRSFDPRSTDDVLPWDGSSLCLEPFALLYHKFD